MQTFLFAIIIYSQHIIVSLLRFCDFGCGYNLVILTRTKACHAGWPQAVEDLKFQSAWRSRKGHEPRNGGLAGNCHDVPMVDPSLIKKQWDSQFFVAIWSTVTMIWQKQTHPVWVIPNVAHFRRSIEYTMGFWGTLLSSDGGLSRTSKDHIRLQHFIANWRIFQNQGRIRTTYSYCISRAEPIDGFAWLFWYLLPSMTSQ